MIPCISEVLTYAVENDQLFPNEVREAGRAHLEKKQIQHEVKVYTGVPHGKFAEVQDFQRTRSSEMRHGGSCTCILGGRIRVSSLSLSSAYDVVGFAVIGEYEDTKIKEAQKEAFKQMVGWLNAH